MSNICSSEPSRRSFIRSKGASSKLNGIRASSLLIRATSASRWAGAKAPNSICSMRGIADSRSSAIGRPCSLRKLVRKASCRPTICATACRKASTLSRPRMRIAIGILLKGRPGWSRSMNQSRSCANESTGGAPGARRRIAWPLGLPEVCRFESIHCARSAMVGERKNSASGSSIPNTLSRRATARVAIKECPPSSKKLASTLSSFFASNSLQIPEIVSSVELRGPAPAVRLV